MRTTTKVLLVLAIVLLAGGAVTAFVLWQPGGDGNIYGTGNTPGNVTNRSTLAYSDGWIYYVSGSNIYRKRTDDTERTLISESMSSSSLVNVAGDWIYFSHGHGLQSVIYRMMTDGTRRERLNDDDAFTISVVDGWIYFSNMTDGWSIFRMRTDGTEQERIRQGHVDSPNIVDGWIYFICSDESRRVHRMRIDGTEETLLSDINTETLIVHDEWIFYTTREERGDDLYFALRRMRLDGTEDEQIYDGRLIAVNAYGDWIFFAPHHEDIELRRLYRMRLDGTEIERLSDTRAGKMVIVADWIYFSRAPVGRLSYRIRMDGTGLESLS